MTDEKHAKLLEKVRALLAKAASTKFPAEADAFRSKANELMTIYAIEQWQVDQAQDSVGVRPTPEIRWMDFSWWSGNPFRDQLWTLFNATARNCRCKVVTSEASYYSQDESMRYKMPVIGLPSDLDWFDLLFTSLMIAMIQKVDPQPVPNATMEENMAMMREAGLPWDDALNRLVKAGIVPSIAQEEAQKLADETGEEVPFSDEDKYRYSGKGFKQLFFSKRVYERTITAYRTWCKRTGHPQSYVNQNTFRRNFCDGFAAEIQERLWRMSRDAEVAYDDNHEAGSMALAVRDIRQVIEDLMFDTWPNLRPHPSDCDCDVCHKCQDPKCKRPRCVAARKPIRMRKQRELSPSEYAARQAGRSAGREVSLTNKSSERIGGNRPGLPGGN